LARCRDKITPHSELPYYDNNGYEKMVLLKLTINQNNFLLEISLLCLFAPCFSENAFKLFGQLRVWITSVHPVECN